MKPDYLEESMESLEARRLWMWEDIHTRFHDGDVRGAERIACQYELEYGGMFFFSTQGVRYESGV
ncbi:conserved hypothetical protein [Vibrio phage 409E50-1]|nr:conserved hypothetical protein [Vibrio phage 521E56-1]CAH9012198.1 conserved hypothetical protein [Vibrio phage 384E50-1]CAH9012224.1 conserved hypothetical protein [Vibrio phage 402E50-1]CAH9012228.1 conserved hypothetical protein [Vibrio phage 409E50-1]CAH9013389.1 conserved hypothetical protein [Vibrio phage 405E50-1]CAH9013443.1 conserved hypothetical protein [Vibrio phage 413E50-1]CAH9015293.1 conserved hypothetical protein [Vibrio phage 177E37-1]